MTRRKSVSQSQFLDAPLKERTEQHKSSVTKDFHYVLLLLPKAVHYRKRWLYSPAIIPTWTRPNHMHPSQAHCSLTQMLTFVSATDHSFRLWLAALAYRHRCHRHCQFCVDIWNTWTVSDSPHYAFGLWPIGLRVAKHHIITFIISDDMQIGRWWRTTPGEVKIACWAGLFV